MATTSLPLPLIHQENHPNVKKVYVVGGSGIIEELAKVGVECIGGPMKPGEQGAMSEKDVEIFDPDPDVGAVIVGMSTDFSYSMITKANAYLRNPDVAFICTNADPYDILNGGAHQPAAGVMVAGIECCSGRKAVNVGKPSKFLFDIICKNFGVEPESSLMVGDRLDTDIDFGVQNSMMSALVFSGCTTGSMAANIYNRVPNPGVVGNIEPTVILPHLGYMCNS